MIDCKDVTIPFNPAGSVARIRVIGPRIVTFSANGDNLIFAADSRRLWGLVTWSGVVIANKIAPAMGLIGGGIGEANATGYILIHNASLPGLVQQAWWMNGNIGDVRWVWEGQLYE